MEWRVCVHFMTLWLNSQQKLYNFYGSLIIIAWETIFVAELMVKAKFGSTFLIEYVLYCCTIFHLCIQFDMSCLKTFCIGHATNSFTSNQIKSCPTCFQSQNDKLATCFINIIFAFVWVLVRRQQFFKKPV